MNDPLLPSGERWSRVAGIARTFAGSEPLDDRHAGSAASETLVRTPAAEGADNLSRISRIVVVKEENWSFDQMLGGLSFTVPVHDFLAEHFTVCDHWHRTVTSSNGPIRTIFSAGTAAEVEKAGHRWGVYRSNRKVEAVRTFDDDCRRGDVPEVVFIDLSSALGERSEIRLPGDVAPGQELVGDIYETLRRHGLLASTLLVVLSVDNGSFFDQVAPPRLGVRFPALVVSAYAAPGSVFRHPLDHTAVDHSILLRFGGDASLGARSAMTRNLGQLLTRATPRSELPSAAPAIGMAREARSRRRGNLDSVNDPPSAFVCYLHEDRG